MYSIKQASIRSGVSVPLIRAWERRYGVVSPERTASGYRLYDDDAIATLVRVRELTETGWSASEASRALLAGEVAISPVQATLPEPSLDPSGNGHRQDLVARFLEAATEIDIAATSAVLDEIFAQGTFESIVDDLLMPALVGMGEAWTEGRLDVAAEHAASAAVHRRLSALFEAAATNGDPLVVVGLPPGARHELGALAFSVAVRRRGVGVLYLGPDVPVASWVHVIQRNRARVAVIASVQEADQAPAIEVADALRRDGNSPVLAVGGRYARWEQATDAGIITLPDRINEAVSLVARLASGTVSERSAISRGTRT
jgi:DNA-binding transcriptional MerR regulator/methylmalonyl-CoA mutase cobalamin-binding subunit